MKPELIAIAFSDIHLHKFKLFDKDNSRLEWSLKALSHISDVAMKNKVPLIFAGDLFHTPVNVENETLTKVITQYKRYIDDRKIPFFAISGNHDMCQKNGIDHHSPSYLETFAEVFKHFYLLDHQIQPYSLPGWSAQIWGIPYMNNDTELKERVKQVRKIAKGYDGFKILLIHGDCPGAMDAGIELGENKALGKKEYLDDGLFKPFDLVLFGHIHAPQKITDKCYMLGSPIQQTSGDKGEMGYWKIYNNQPPKFYGLVDYPKFVKLGKDEKPYNKLDYFILHEEIGAVEAVEKGDFDLSNSRTKLGKRYLKVKGIKDPKKKRALINALKEVE